MHREPLNRALVVTTFVLLAGQPQADSGPRVPGVTHLAQLRPRPLSGTEPRAWFRAFRPDQDIATIVCRNVASHLHPSDMSGHGNQAAGLTRLDAVKNIRSPRPSPMRALSLKWGSHQKFARPYWQQGRQRRRFVPKTTEI